MDRTKKAAGLLLLAGTVFLTACAGRHPDEPLARTTCGSCHAFPQPELLHQGAWEKRVLPDMGRRLGISYINGLPFQEIYPGTGLPAGHSPGVSFEDWLRIVRFYQSEAPEEQPRQDRPPVTETTPLFAVTGLPARGGTPSTSYIRIDPGNGTVYWGHAADSALEAYHVRTGQRQSWGIGSVLIDIGFNEDLRKAGARSGILTNIGIMNPNNKRTGSASTFRLSGLQSFTAGPRFLDTLPRPVQVTASDLDGDGDPDYLVCGFGHDNGAFFWMQNNGGRFEQKMLRPLPGCIRAVVDDFNGDGRPDIMALFAQAQEGIYLFTNEGNGQFTTRVLLEFPPVYGSSYFELVDLDRDGRRDILYTCGDNADLTADVLKNYHGIYIFLNRGDHNYRQAYFYPVNGCYKAMARDFDGDGDLDIASISYFPDKQAQPGEAFVYLEQQGDLRFRAYTIPGHGRGDWLTMDAGDADGDGDEDIVIGNLQMPNRAATARPDSARPAFLLLRNKTRDR